MQQKMWTFTQADRDGSSRNVDFEKKGKTSWTDKVSNEEKLIKAGIC